MILSLQYPKLIRKQNENTKEEWMGHLRIKGKHCSYKEKDRRLKEHFINGINDVDMMTKIIRELTTIIKTKVITSEQLFMLGQESWDERESNIRCDNESKEFAAIKIITNRTMPQTTQKEVERWHILQQYTQATQISSLR